MGSRCKFTPLLAILSIDAMAWAGGMEGQSDVWTRFDSAEFSFPPKTQCYAVFFALLLLLNLKLVFTAVARACRRRGQAVVTWGLGTLARGEEAL